MSDGESAMDRSLSFTVGGSSFAGGGMALLLSAAACTAAL